MNILAGVLPKDGGRILLDGRSFEPANRREADAAGISFTQQELSIFPNLSVAENLFLGRFARLVKGLPLVARRRMREETRELLRAVELDVDPDTLAESLSTGERQLLEIARGLASDIRVLILDEPTTSLTEREANRLFGIIARLKEHGVAIVYVSHVLGEILRLADRVLVMRDGRVALSERNMGLTSRQLVFAMVGRSIETLFPTRSPRAAAPAQILEASRVGDQGSVREISLTLSAGEIVGVSGLMGSGRSKLARILFGLDPHRDGYIRVGTRALGAGDLGARLAAGVAFVTEDRRRDSLLMDATVAQNMALASLPMFARGPCRVIDERKLADKLAGLVDRLSVRCGDINSTKVRTLSGGNQQKTVLARWLLRNPTVLLLDEPTRGIDVGAKEEIYRLLTDLAERGSALLVISSELEELTGLCDRILVIHRGRIVREFSRDQFDRAAILRAAFGQSDV